MILLLSQLGRYDILVHVALLLVVPQGVLLLVRLATHTHEGREVVHGFVSTEVGARLE